MRFLFGLLTLSASPAFAFICPSGAHLCTRPSSTHGIRNLCVQFNKDTVLAYNDSVYRRKEFDFKTGRHWSGCRTVFLSKCTDQWVKVTESKVTAYKYSYSPYAPGESIYKYMELDLKTNRAYLSYEGFGLPDIEYECTKLTETYKGYFIDFVVPKLPNSCSQELGS